MARVGIIGGTGFDSPDILKEVTRKKIHTPYGPPSDLVTLGKYEHVDIAIIPRHGSSHNINPTLVNYRANIWALKELGLPIFLPLLPWVRCGKR